MLAAKLEALGNRSHSFASISAMRLSSAATVNRSSLAPYSALGSQHVLRCLAVMQGSKTPCNQRRADLRARLSTGSSTFSVEKSPRQGARCG
jgi:hypothetical protein